METFEVIGEFERLIANYFGSPYAVATDCCTHALELCLRYENYNNIEIPQYTYISVPFTAKKLGLNWKWKDEKWNDYYYLGNTNIIDAAVFWKKNSYIENTYMCVSFQFRKHLSLGRGGIILLDNYENYKIIKKMSYDGRNFDSRWGNQNIDMVGYHYYMTPETAREGINKFQKVKDISPNKWGYKDYPFLPSMKVFNKNGFE